MKKVLLIICLAVLSISVKCQDTNLTVFKADIRKQEKQGKMKTDKNTYFSLDTIQRIASTRKFPDISNYYEECYLSIVNQYGFWKGVGKPLSKSEKKHSSGYYKLLRPKGGNKNAPFTHLQIFGTHGRLENSSYGPHLANPFGNDDRISDAWKYKLQEICQCEKISRDGILIQENMYDSSGTLILQYYPTTVSKDHIIGHYVDPWGALANLRGLYGAKYVSIHLDSNGYEASLAFMDEDGILERNSDDAFITLYDNDKSGNITRIMSADIFGNPMIDKYGNCGWVNTYNTQGNVLTARCINHRGEPMRMPKKQKDATDAWQYECHYDKWGRLDTQSYYDSIGKPDTITGGIHRRIYEYDEYGNLTSYRTEGLNSKLVNYSDDLAWMSREYDNRGNIIYESYRNKDTLLKSSGDCINMYNYLKNGATFTFRYKTTDGHDTILTWKEFESERCDTTWDYEEPSISVVNKDFLGRNSCDVYYDTSMNPISGPSKYHRLDYEYTVDAQKRTSMEIKRLTDSLGNPCDITASGYWRDYNIQITEVDSVKHTKIFSQYDGQELLKKYGNYYTDDFSSSIGDMSFDTIGMRGRSCHNYPFYFSAIATKSESGNVVTISGRNEFDEPSYILTGDYDGSLIYCMDIKSDYYYFDEFGDTIPRYGRKQFKDSLYKSFCIEILDSSGFELGLQSGDLIVGYGDWNYPEPSQYGRYWENTLIYETIIKATKEKDIIVIRHHPEKQTSELVRLRLPKGTPKQLGFVYHMLYMTSKEKERYEHTVETQDKFVELNSNNTHLDGSKKISFIVPYKFNSDTDYTYAFRKGFDENAVVLAWQLFENDTAYFFNCYRGYSNYGKFIDQDNDSIALYYTVDGITVKQWIIPAENNKAFFKSVRRSYTSDFINIKQFRYLSDSLQFVFESENNITHECLSPHHVADKLLSMPGTRIIELDTANFSRNGWYYGDVKNAYQIQVNGDSLSVSEMIMAKDLLSHIDYKQYTYIRSENEDYAYFLEEKGRFKEAIWNNDNSITFLEGELTMPDKMIVVLETEENGQLEKKGIVGNYVLLQYNEWIFGMDRNELKRIINGSTEEKKIVIAKIIQKDGNVDLGKKKKYTFEGDLGVRYQWKAVTDDIFNKAYKYRH